LGSRYEQESKILKIGDLVGHRFENGLGVILEAPEQTNNGDYLVHFANKRKPKWYREKYLEVISANK
jgi:hypothetical protein